MNSSGGFDRARAAATTAEAVHVLLTLDGHVPAEVQLRALRRRDEVAVRVLCGVGWRAADRGDDRAADRADERADDGAGAPAFLGELALSTSGRVLLRTPGSGALSADAELVGGRLRLPWTTTQLRAYEQGLRRSTEAAANALVDARRWLAAAGGEGRDGMLDVLVEASLRTAPFVLYQEDRRYTNFRDLNTITGKTLWPGHPDCLLSSLRGVPLTLWSDSDVLLVVCLTLLVRSGTFARVEEANGTQLSLDHVAHLLDRVRVTYNAVGAGPPVPPAQDTGAAALDRLAGALRERRALVGRQATLYRVIHGALVHKIETVAGPEGPAARARVDAVVRRLATELPVSGGSPEEMAERIAEHPNWLARPWARFATGFEALVHGTVAACAEAFEADFTMSRGIRSLPALVRALRAEDWATITSWEIARYYCCVVPGRDAERHFDGSRARTADMAWAMSSRMQYNSWHFIAGNLPREPVVVARDHFVPPVIPDLAHHSDQHHHGHVTARVRYSIRSPCAVEILGRRFDGFVDLRLLRCAGPPFDEQDLVAARRISSFVGRVTDAVAALVAAGVEVEVRSFDSRWHRDSVVGADPVGDR